MKRVSINELMRETGLSRATIDRVLNGRGNVHERTKFAVEQSLSRLATAPSPPPAREATKGPEADVVLRLGRGMLEQLKRASASAAVIHDMHQRDDAQVLALTRELCQDVSRPLVIAAKNSEALRFVLTRSRARGKRVVTVVSDLAHDARDAFVGIDNRMAGQTAAFVLGHLFAQREAKVGVVLGDYAFSCHEDREIGFRTGLRGHFPDIQVADVAKSDDSPEQTHAAVRELLRVHPGIDGVYNVGGGNAGLVRAIVESRRSVRVIAHEANHVTAPLARSGQIHYLISQNPRELLERALEIAAVPVGEFVKEIHFVDFGVYTRFNLPSYSEPED